MKYILAQDESIYSLWQIETAVSSLLKIGVKDTDIYVLLGTYGYNKPYKALFRRFKSVNFIQYRNLSDLKYKPSVKPYLLWRFFEQYSELVSEQWFLMDCDVVLTKKLAKFKKGTTYVSDCGSYMNIKYIEDCGFSAQDFANYLDIDVEVIEKLDNNIGGAQYVFDNIPAEAWKWAYEMLPKFKSEVEKNQKDCRIFQIWCREMFTVIYSLAMHSKVKKDKRLDFSWSTDHIKLGTKKIIHNAGVTGSEPVTLFNKGHYSKTTPPSDLEIDENYVSSIYYKYVKER